MIEGAILLGAVGTAFGKFVYDSFHQPNLEDYLTHFWLVGKTGHFKSTYIRQELFLKFKLRFPNSSIVNFITKDADDLNSFLNMIPECFHSKTLVYAPTDMAENDRWIGLNLLERSGRSPLEDTLITNELIACFERAFGESIKSNSKDILRNCTLAILDVLPRPSLLELYKMISDSLGTPEDTLNRRRGEDYKSPNPWRDELIKLIKNKPLKYYFENNFIRPTIRTMDLYNPISNKLRIINDPTITNTLCQSTGLNLDDYINSGWIICFYFPKGELGPETSRLLSSIAFSKTQLTIQSRSRLDRTSYLENPIMVIADEFHDYVTYNTSFQDFLMQARSFGASLVLSQQYIQQGDQYSRALTECIDGNVGNIICGRLGLRDSEFMSNSTGLDKSEFEKLEKLIVFERLMINGRPSKIKKRRIHRLKFIHNEGLKLRSVSLNLGVDRRLLSKSINTRLFSADIIENTDNRVRTDIEKES